MFHTLICNSHIDPVLREARNIDLWEHRALSGREIDPTHLIAITLDQVSTYNTVGVGQYFVEKYNVPQNVHIFPPTGAIFW